MSRTLCKHLERTRIIHVKSIPYHHNSNGRVERLNRTLRTAIQKLKGRRILKVSKAVKAYNAGYHRDVPNRSNIPRKRGSCEAQSTEIYAREFVIKIKEQLSPERKFKIHNENKVTKYDDEFSDRGTIQARAKKDGYIL